jgi:hypothetical protein
MESAPRKQVDWDAYAIGFPLIVWGASFFFPTLIGHPNDWIFPETSPGFLAPIASFLMMVIVIVIGSEHGAMKPPTPEEVVLYFSICTLWLANLWMVLAPAWVKRLRDGRGQLFLVAAWFWTLVPLPIAIKAPGNHSDIGGFKIATGFYVWWSSFFFMALICTAHYLRSRRNQLEPYPPSPR